MNLEEMQALEAQLRKAQNEAQAWRRAHAELAKHVKALGELTEPGMDRHPVTVAQAARVFVASLLKELDAARKEAP